jgi:AcrR family transcriptional regulator
MSQPAQMRSSPKQERGERRVQRILAAAEQLFAERGYEATTTNEIAIRAETSIGTLYRFFPNKESIVRLLGERYAQEMHTLREKMFCPEMATMPLVNMIDRLVDPIVDLKTKHSGLISVFIGPKAALHLPFEYQALQNESVQLLETLWMKRFSHFTTEMCHLYAIIFFQIRMAFLSLAFSSPPELQEQIIVELKTNLLRYLEPLDRQDTLCS